MTLEEGIKILVNIVDLEIKNSGWWIFNKRNLELGITKILEPYEKSANLPLPEKLYVYNMTIDKYGISCHEDLIEWSEICATGIKTETISDGNSETYIYKKHLLICLHNRSVLQYYLGDISSLKGLLGHFIEQYKFEYLNKV
jgi:hypothetical protein